MRFSLNPKNICYLAVAIVGYCIVPNVSMAQHQVIENTAQTGSTPEAQPTIYRKWKGTAGGAILTLELKPKTAKRQLFRDGQNITLPDAEVVKLTAEPTSQSGRIILKLPAEQGNGYEVIDWSGLEAHGVMLDISGIPQPSLEAAERSAGGNFGANVRFEAQKETEATNATAAQASRKEANFSYDEFVAILDEVDADLTQRNKNTQDAQFRNLSPETKIKTVLSAILTKKGYEPNTAFEAFTAKTQEYGSDVAVQNRMMQINTKLNP